jgi:hypothetical protein
MATLPSYYLFQVLLQSREAFAGSAFACHVCEWAYGFMIGCSFGHLATAVTVLIRTIRVANITTVEPTGSQDGNEEEDGSWWPWSFGKETNANDEKEKDDESSCCTKLVEYLFGLLFLSTAIAASVLMALTWHSCLAEDQDECINHSSTDGLSTGGLLAAFLAVPVTVLFVAGWLQIQR